MDLKKLSRLPIAHKNVTPQDILYFYLKLDEDNSCFYLEILGEKDHWQFKYRHSTCNHR